MRFSLLVLCIPLMSASAAQAQDLHAIATVPNSPGKMAGLPSMPKPKSSSEGCGLSRSACLRSPSDPINPPAHPYATLGHVRVADKKFWAIAAATMGTSVLASPPPAIAAAPSASRIVPATTAPSMACKAFNSVSTDF